jgi:hypothetical protein
MWEKVVGFHLFIYGMMVLTDFAAKLAPAD